MTLARPALLLALAALPILWLLARRAAARRDLPVTSLLLWRRIGLSPDAPDRTKRRSDRLLWLRMAAAAAIAAGLAGPVIRGAPSAPVLNVLLDASPSMAAFGANVARALERVETHAGSDVEVRVHRRDGIGDLPALLATAGGGDVVVVTDHRPPGFEDGERVRLLLVGEPVSNAGFTALWIDRENRFTAVVRNFGSEEREFTVIAGSERTVVRIAAGEAARVEGAAPGGEVELTLDPGDRFPFDDVARAIRRAPRTMTLAWTGPAAPRLALALEIAGIRIGDARERISYRTPPGEGARILVAPPGRRREVEGTPVAGAELAPEAAPPAGLPLGPAAILAPGGTVLLADRAGPLAVDRDGRIEVALDPADPASAWTSDPSFPVFVAEIARRLGVEEEVAVPMRMRRESATRPESGPLRLTGATPSPAPPPPERDFTALLFLLAALLLIAHTFLARGVESASKN